MEQASNEKCIATLLFGTVSGLSSQKGLWWGCITLPSNATDHCIVRVDDVAFSFVALDNSMPCSEKAFPFSFTSVRKFLTGSPSHAVENDACPVLVHLAVLVNDTGRVPRIMSNGATDLVALSIETLSVLGVLGLNRPD